jgi:GTP-binding protein Era
VKSGFVPVVGRPNVGKSTLVNGLVGTKVAITSSRRRPRELAFGESSTTTSSRQCSSTRGVHRPRTVLGARLNAVVTHALADADAVVFVIDATGKIGPGDRLIAERLRAAAALVVCVVNKIDVAPPGSDRAPPLAGAWDFAAHVPVSAREGTNLSRSPPSWRRCFPRPAVLSTDMPTDQAEELIGEIIGRSSRPAARRATPFACRERRRDPHPDNGVTA